VDVYSQRAQSIATFGIVALLAVAAVGNLATAGDTVPPFFSVVAPFIAAAFLSQRATIITALVALLQSSLLARYGSGLSGWALAARVGMALVAGVIAVVVVEARHRHDRILTRANADLLLAELVQSVVDSARDPIYAKDTEGRYLLANQATAELLGAGSGPDLVGHRDRELVAPDAADRIEADDQHTLATGGLVEFEEEIRGADGAERLLLTHKSVLIDADGSVIGVAGVAKDITVRRAAQRELERSELRFRSLVETTAAIVWEADAQGLFTEPQERWEAYTGQTWEQHGGLGWLEAVHPTDRERVAAQWRQGAERQVLRESEARLWHAASGAHRHVVFRAVAVTDPVSAATEWLGTVEDVHARVVAEEELRRVADARSLVAEAAAAMGVVAGSAEVAEAVLAVLEERLPPHVGVVSLAADPGPGSSILAVRGTRGWEGLASLGTGVRLPTSQVIARGSRLEFADGAALAAAFTDAGPIVAEIGIDGPGIVVPLVAGARLVGALGVFFLPAISTDDHDLTRRTLDKLAPVVAAALLQAELLQRGAEIASSFQQSMLELALQADPRLAVSVHYQAGAEQMEAGGDWYDVVPLADGRIAVVVGDVVGRSLKAATVMGRLRGACRGLILASGDPGEVLSHLDAVAGTIDGARFATCVCLILDPATETASYSSAGHPPALVLSDEDDAHFLWDAQGPPLSVPTGGPRPVATVPFVTGTRVFLYTDGLVERRDEVLDKGFDRLVRAVTAGRGMGIDRECDRVTTALFDDFAQQDDVAIICAELISRTADVLDRTLDPDPELLHRIRHDLHVWLAGHRVAEQPAANVVLAVAEVLANAVEHAGASAGGISLHAEHLGGRQFRVVVTDGGRWREPAAVPDPVRGRGLAIARALVDHVEVDSTPAGTTVTLDVTC
jgi:PAS domain S-box-containing protein